MEAREAASASTAAPAADADAAPESMAARLARLRQQRSAERIPVDDDEARQSSLEKDVATLVGLGLHLADIEKLWECAGVGAQQVRLVGERLMREQHTAVPVARQASLGLDLLQGDGCGNAESITVALDALRAEWNDPPERFRDPIMLTLMDEPMVISSGHTFDQTTLFDARGEFRFERCPMTRAVIDRRAFPLVFLRREIVEFKLRRLDAVLQAASRCRPELAAPLLSFARQLLDSLGAERYRGQASEYWRLRLRTGDATPDGWLSTLAELASALDASNCTLTSLVDAHAARLEAQALTLAKGGDRMGVASLVLSTVSQLHPLASRPCWARLWISLTRSLCPASEPELRTRLAAAIDMLPPPRDATGAADAGADPGGGSQGTGGGGTGGGGNGTSGSMESQAVPYWEVRLQLCADDAEAVGVLQRLGAELVPSTVDAISVRGAGVSACNGEYVRDGDYAGAPCFKNGRWWILRYRMPSGRLFWYIADKDRLTQDAGDLYRIRSASPLPPCHQRWSCAADGEQPTPSLSAVQRPPVGRDSPLRTMFAERKAALHARGVDVSALERPPRGIVAAIEARKGWYVDRVVFWMRPPRGGAGGAAAATTAAAAAAAATAATAATADAGAATAAGAGGEEDATRGERVVYGGDGGGEVAPFHLHEGEALIGVRQWTDGQYLGSCLRFTTSEGREYAVVGERFSGVEHELTAFEADEGCEIAALQFDGARLSAVLRVSGGALAGPIADAPDADWHPLTPTAAAAESDDFSTGSEEGEEEGESNGESEGEEEDEEEDEWGLDGFGGLSAAMRAPEAGADLSALEADEELQMQLALALSLADANEAASPTPPAPGDGAAAELT